LGKEVRSSQEVVVREETNEDVGSSQEEVVREVVVRE
jgi:hypothetical protein